jgi:hypothetical protein
MTFDDFVDLLKRCAGSDQINIVQVKQSPADKKANRSRYDAVYKGVVFIRQIYKKQNGDLGAAYIIIPGLNRKNRYDDYLFNNMTYKLDNDGHLKVNEAIAREQLNDIIEFILSQI